VHASAASVRVRRPVGATCAVAAGVGGEMNEEMSDEDAAKPSGADRIPRSSDSSLLPQRLLSPSGTEACGGPEL
jgi:hypothetical protein